MDAVRRFAVGLRLIAGRHSRRVWLLWGLVALVLVLTPFALLEPAAWLYVFDPELAALVVMLGLTSLRTRIRLPRRTR